MSDFLTKPLEQLPHGAEFRFVDALTALEPGQRGAGTYYVRGDESFLKGHFPHAPLMPGVLLVEALAQLAGVVAQSDPSISPLENLRLTAIRSAKILGSAIPGQTLQLEVTIVGRMGPLIQAQGKVSVDGTMILSADVVLSGTPPLE